MGFSERPRSINWKQHYDITIWGDGTLRVFDGGGSICIQYVATEKMDIEKRKNRNVPRHAGGEEEKWKGRFVTEANKLYAGLLDRFLLRRGLFLGHRGVRCAFYGNSGLGLLLRGDQKDANRDEGHKQCEPWDVGDEFDWMDKVSDIKDYKEQEALTVENVLVNSGRARMGLNSLDSGVGKLNGADERFHVGLPCCKENHEGDKSCQQHQCTQRKQDGLES